MKQSSQLRQRRPVPLTLHFLARSLGIRFASATCVALLSSVSFAAPYDIGAGGSLKRSPAEERGVGPFLGHSLAMSDDVIVAGAPYADVGEKVDAGVAIVVVRDSSGAWRASAVLIAPDGAADEQFGWSVAVYGDTIAVGAPRSAATSFQGGRVYLFERNSGGANRWGLAGTVSPVQKNSWHFGYSLSLSQDTLVVGAPFPTGLQGQVHVFSRTGSAATAQWSPLAVLLSPPANEPQQNFGVGVTTDGKTIAVSSRPGQPGATLNFGLVYLYQRSEASEQPQWRLRKTLQVEGHDAADGIGDVMALESGRLAVGAPIRKVGKAALAGAVQIFQLGSSTEPRSEGALSSSSPATLEQYGESIALDGDLIAVGIPRRGSAQGKNTGVAELWSLKGTPWRRIASLESPTPEPFAVFGRTVAINGKTLAVGAIGQAGSAGRLYIFQAADANRTTWQFVQQIP
jgi:hypothetical protein